MKKREAIIGLMVYKAARPLVKRMFRVKGGGMAGKKKSAMLAGFGALLGGLLFWRKRKAKHEL